jgi:hypothetical protein
MKILLVADLAGWAIENRCKAIKKFLPQHEFTIFAERDKEQYLLQHTDDFDLIHLNYSFGLTRLLRFIKQYPQKIIITLSNERTILDGDGGDPKTFKELLKSVRTATSVSKTLADEYT